MHHQSGEALECTRYAHSRADFDEHAFRGRDVDLKFASFVHWRIKEGEEALMSSRQQPRIPHEESSRQAHNNPNCCARRYQHEMKFDILLQESTYLMRDIRTSITNISVHLPHYPNVFITIQQRVLFVSTRHTRSARGAMGSFVSL